MIIIDNKIVANVLIGGKPVISITSDGKEIYKKDEGIDYFYLQSEADASSTVTLKKTGTPATTDLQYSYDKENWEDVDLSASSTTYNLSKLGDRVYFRSTTGFGKAANAYFTFGSLQSFSASGNICSLIDYTKMDDLTSTSTYAFYRLFYQAIRLIKANFNFGNIETISQNGLTSCFEGCTRLTTVPDFSKIKLIAASSLGSCFEGCTSLTTVPDFSNVTSVLMGGYANCFKGCTSLTKSPNFSNITSVTMSGYTNCFNGCTNLNYVYAPKIASWTSTVFNKWLENAATTGTIKVSETTTNIPTDSTSGIPTGWTVEYYD